VIYVSQIRSSPDPGALGSSTTDQVVVASTYSLDLVVPKVVCNDSTRSSTGTQVPVLEYLYPTVLVLVDRSRVINAISTNL